jgi:hypothetical protein
MLPPDHRDVDVLVEEPALLDCPSPAPSTLRESSLDPGYPVSESYGDDSVATPPSMYQEDIGSLETLHDTLRLRGGAADEEDGDDGVPADKAANGAAENDGNVQPAEPSLED